MIFQRAGTDAGRTRGKSLRNASAIGAQQVRREVVDVDQN